MTSNADADPHSLAGSGKKQPGAARQKKAREPLYIRIAAALRQEIARGTYPVGSQLPTEDMLCEMFSVSRHTIRDALRLLREENLVLSRKKAGTLVALPQTPDSNFVHATSIDDLMSFSSRWHFAIDSIVMAPLDPQLASWVHGPADQDWLTFGGLARIEGASLPECWATYYVDRDYASLSSLVRDYTGRILPLIESRFGVKIVLMIQEFTAALIPSELAGQLQVDTGSAAISVRRMYKTAEGKLAFITTEIYPASRFRYTTALHRDAARPTRRAD